MEADVTKISPKETPGEMLPLLSPQEHIKQRVKTVIELIRGLLEIDSNCSGGVGHVLNVSLYEDAVIEQVIASIEDRWEIKREGYDNKKLRIRPLFTMNLSELQTLIMNQRLRWNFDDGPLHINVESFRSDVVVKMIELLKEKNWDASAVWVGPDWDINDKHSTPLRLSIDMKKPAES